MVSLLQRYSTVCADLQLATSPDVLRVLRESGRSRSGIRLPGGCGRLRDDDVLALCVTLRQDVTVAGLDLRYNRVTDEGAQHLADLLQHNVAIEHLDLMCNDIEAEGAELLANSLHGNSTLRSLRMAGNKIASRGSMRFAAMLQVNSTLRALDMSDCDLDTQSLIGFTIVLSTNKSIQAVDLSRPLLFSHQEETMVHLARMLQVNQHLQELHLGQHGMTDSGVERLCEALRRNSVLRYLDLRCNCITRDGAKCLAEILRHNSTLEILDLSSNRIEDDGAGHLSKAIAQHNRSLRALSVTSNSIASRGLLLLTEAMQVNPSLSHIYIWGNKLEEPLCTAVSSLLQSGRLCQEATDVSLYEVDGQQCLAEVFHGLRRHYYWTSNFDVHGDSAANSALVLMGWDTMF
ncbi:leucine-rich repeat-containing protein 34 [Brienomyrus brachyistius]|uniref:leucine-rich repeat-containing protein 34 n=1 Tax=Brienomyrus brachyistius TaxID=42636 RepID=UPI0020B19764|nr:leucine-rich repeat-containing protein 34 [Brienomyrus brachyistius]